MSAGRPSIYSHEITKEICDRLANGETLRKICKSDHLPALRTVMDWLRDENKKEFAQQYADARIAQAQHFFDELMDISDDATNDWMTKKDGSLVFNKEAAMRSRLRVDTRKWYLSKIVPKIYGDKLDLTTDGKALPTPILAGLTQTPNVPSDDSSQKDPETQ